MKAGVLAVQGAFIEHEKMLSQLGCECVELRSAKDICSIDRLVLPGGESTVQGKLLRELNMMEPLREMITSGVPVLATCAGLILLSQKLSNDSNVYFGTLPVTVKRNAYGRQLGSFQTEADFKPVGNFQMTFIRGPYIEETGDGVETLAVVDDKIVGVRYKNQVGLSFHPEMGQDLRIHEYFLTQLR